MSRFEQIRDRRMQNPEFRERYERSRRSIAAIQQILQTIEATREEAGLSKAALARRAGTNPAATRRLLTCSSGNPTLATVLDIAGALGLELRIVPRRRALRRPATGLRHKDTGGSTPSAPVARGIDA
jgi:DNA-binding phage protein